MTRIILTRHGHVEGIEPERFRGRADIPLTEQGEVQARALARRIAREWPPAAIYTSPLERCRATAAEIGKACGVDVRELADLVDLDYGVLQWKTCEEVSRDYPELYRRWLAAPQSVHFPQGESLQDLAARVANVVRLMDERHRADTIVLVAHDSVNRVLLMQTLDQPLSSYRRISQSPCAINEIVIEGLQIRVERINDTCHLR
jgi:phosphoserine phosphatase